MPLIPTMITQVERPEAHELAVLAAAGVATVHEAYARTGLMHDLAPVIPDAVVAGSAVTALCYTGDNLMVHAALEVVQPGDILVIAVTAPSTHAMVGDLLATSCQAKGVTAAVVDAGVRDTQALRQMGFPVWARHIGVAGTVKRDPGWLNIPVSCGGQVVHPGDAVVADADGVVVVARSDVTETAQRAQQRIDAELVLREEMAAGGSSLDRGGRRAVLAEHLGGPQDA